MNLHLAAAEHRGGIVFLHEVRDGPASRSYGLQVARLAGLPPAVIRAASQLLNELETRARSRDDQLDLFAMRQEAADLAGPGADGADAGLALHLLERLRRIDPDALSARDALELLYELRTQAGEPPSAS